ncbi:MAG: hypothetical protein C3F12_07595 [Candidatus Methylomirabilota bacterium]|nr:hypothetical protein [Candidatus Methylomirabilis sp.]NJD67155.1 hypothetical protein [candidate division NC10 bacterium]PWB45928.1 MAG: hypothetical protein C3F12_07595 [candidate division NC10 bacterium]
MDWPFIRHPTPYLRTPMTQGFRRQRLIVNERLEAYDGTIAVVQNSHLSADEIECVRWQADR